MPKPDQKWLKSWVQKSGCVSSDSGSCDKSAHGLDQLKNWGKYTPKKQGVSSWTCKYKGDVFNHCIFWAEWDDGEKLYIDATARQFGWKLPKILIGTKAFIQQELEKKGSKTSDVKHVSDGGSDAGRGAMLKEHLGIESEDGSWHSPPSSIGDSEDLNSDQDSRVIQTLERAKKKLEGL